METPLRSDSHFPDDRAAIIAAIRPMGISPFELPPRGLTRERAHGERITGTPNASNLCPRAAMGVRNGLDEGRAR